MRLRNGSKTCLQRTCSVLKRMIRRLVSNLIPGSAANRIVPEKEGSNRKGPSYANGCRPRLVIVTVAIVLTAASVFSLQAGWLSSAHAEWFSGWVAGGSDGQLDSDWIRPQRKVPAETRDRVHALTERRRLVDQAIARGRKGQRGQRSAPRTIPALPGDSEAPPRFDSGATNPDRLNLQPSVMSGRWAKEESR